MRDLNVDVSIGNTRKFQLSYNALGRNSVPWIIVKD